MTSHRRSSRARWSRRRERALAPILLLGLLAAGCARSDLAGWRDRTLPAAGAAPVPGKEVAVSFLGVSTLLFSDGETALMTDGFFSRPGLWSVVVGRIEPDPDRIAAALEAAGIDELAAIAVVHSHYDHAMDAPEVARRTGAVVLGSESTANVARGAGLEEASIVVVEPGRRYAFGRFGVTFLESRHIDFGANASTLGGSIDEPLVPPARAGDYEEGGSYSIWIDHPAGNLLVQGSAGFVEGALAGRQADAVFLGVGGLDRMDEAYRDAYWRNVVEVVSPSLVVPIHWDDFTRPLDQPLVPPPGWLADTEAVLTALDTYAKATPDLTLALAPPGTPVQILPR